MRAPSSMVGAQPARRPGRSASTHELAADALHGLLARAVDLGHARRRRRPTARRRTRARGGACASRDAAGRARARARLAAPALRRSRRRSRSDGARSRPRPSRPRASPTSSKRRPAPRKRASTGAASLRSTPASSRAASAAAALRRLCSPGTASSTATGSSSQPRTTAGTCSSHRSKSSATSCSDAKVAWWSSSTFVTTAICGRSCSIGPVRLVALDDEPPLPRAGVAAELRDLAADEPRRVEAELGEDERDHRRRRRLAVGAGDDDRAAQRDELGEELRSCPAAAAARVRGRDHGLPAVADDRLGRDLHLDAVERREIRGLDPVPAAHLRPPRAGEERVRRQPRAADADEPDPASLKRRQARSAPRRSRRPRPAAPSPASPPAFARAAPGRRAAPRRGRERGRARLSGTTTAPPPRSKWRAFSVWWSPVACGYGTRTAGVPAAASSQTVPPAREIARSGAAERGAELVRVREHDVVVARHRGANPFVVALAGQVQDGRPRIPVLAHGEVVERGGAGHRAEEGEQRRVLAKPEPLASRRPATPWWARGTGRPVTRYLSPFRLGQVVGEEDAPRERRRQPVREPEVGIRLRQCGRDPQRAGREHHRAGDVATSTQDDVRPPPAQDPHTGCGRQPRPDERAQERNGRPAGKARDRERIERVAVSRDEPSLDPLGRPRERDQHSALAQGFRHCERRQHVAGCSAGRDETPEPGVRLAGGRVHPRRC